jgi:putative transposase
MVSPERRRQAVGRLRECFGVSERRACAVVGQYRSTQRRPLSLIPGDELLRKKLKAMAAAHPRWGYRKQHHLLCRQGWEVNRKRVRRIWREESLQVKRRKRRRRRTGRRSPGGIQACYPNHVWAADFEADQTRRGRRLKILNITDEFTHEGIAGKVAYSIDAASLIEVLDAFAAERGAPRYLRCDNGPEFISKLLERWCREQRRTATEFIEPGSPWQNPFVESYNGRMRDELLNLELFENAFEAQVVIDDWRWEFNNVRPHRSLGMATPAEFAARWKAEYDVRVS